jgi:hypothetical protein
VSETKVYQWNDGTAERSAEVPVGAVLSTASGQLCTSYDVAGGGKLSFCPSTGASLQSDADGEVVAIKGGHSGADGRALVVESFVDGVMTQRDPKTGIPSQLVYNQQVAE